MNNTKETIQDIFIDTATEVGCICRRHKLPEDCMWELARTLDKVFSRALEQLREKSGEDETPSEKQHPAFTHLLWNLKKQGKNNE